jgi:hypothetical protein
MASTMAVATSGLPQPIAVAAEIRLSFTSSQGLGDLDRVESRCCYCRQNLDHIA